MELVNNKNAYSSHPGYLDLLNVSGDGSLSGWDTRKDTEYQNLGIVSTNKSDPSTSNLTVRITATGVVFNIDVQVGSTGNGRFRGWQNG